MRPGTNHEMMPDDVDAVLVVGLDFADDMPQDVGPDRDAWHVAALARIEAETGVALADLMPAPGTDPDYRTACARLNAAGFDTYDSDTTLEAYSAPVTCGPDCARECAPVAPAAPEPPRRMTRADILELELDRLAGLLRDAHETTGHRWTWTGNIHAPVTYSCACGLRAEPATVARLAHTGDPVTGVRSTISTDDAGPARRMLRELDRNASHGHVTTCDTCGRQPAYRSTDDRYSMCLPCARRRDASHDRVTATGGAWFGRMHVSADMVPAMAPDTPRTWHAELLVGTVYAVTVQARTRDEALELLADIDPDNLPGDVCDVDRHVLALDPETDR